MKKRLSLGVLVAWGRSPGFAGDRAPLRDWGQSRPRLDMTWVMVATVLVLLMQAGFLLLEIGFSRQKNVGAGVAKILVNLGIADDRLVGGRPGHQRPGQLDLRHRRVLLPHGSGDRLGRRGVPGRQRRPRVHAVRPRLRGGLAGDRLGHDAGADQVRRLRDLRGRVRRDHLPADRARRVVRGRPARRHRRQGSPRLRRLARSSTSPAPPPGSRRCSCSGARRASTARTGSRGRSRGTRCRWSASAS